LIDWLIDWFIHSFIHSFIHWLTHSFIAREWFKSFTKEKPTRRTNNWPSISSSSSEIWRASSSSQLVIAGMSLDNSVRSVNDVAPAGDEFLTSVTYNMTHRTHLNQIPTVTKLTATGADNVSAPVMSTNCRLSVIIMPAPILCI